MQPDAPACANVRLQQIRIAGAFAFKQLRASDERHDCNSIEPATIAPRLQ
jgi:hypothetical protein